MIMAENNNNGATTLSCKDTLVLIVMASFGAAVLGLGIYGQKGLIEKCTTSDFWDLVGIFLSFAAITGIFTYILVRLAAQYIVYIAIRILLTLLDPVNPQRVRRKFNRLVFKSEEN